jgi:ATP-binding cassette subfamily B (MDR/TAP) protein 1
MQNRAPVHTPLTVKDKLSSSQSPSTNEEQRQILRAFKNLNYLERVGSLLYACQTCLDIAHATGVLAQFGANPGKPHYEALKRVLRYLKGTAHFGLTFGRSDNKTDLIGWSDTD